MAPPILQGEPIDLAPESVQIKGFEPAALTARSEPIYPGEAANIGISTGYARVGLLVDSAGAPGNLLAIEYSHEAFARSLIDSARHWSFRPAIVDGVAVPSRFFVAWRFYPKQAIWTNVTEAVDAKFDFGGGRNRLVYFPRNEDELDEKPQLTYFEIPQAPEGYVIDPADDRVTVVFFINEKGEVCLPHVEIAPSPELIIPAMAAVSQWRFTVPTVDGEPVLAIVSRRIKVVGYRLTSGERP
ncbi:MAG: energy transducer TonB [Opitutaceae bacterium]